MTWYVTKGNGHFGLEQAEFCFKQFVQIRVQVPGVHAWEQNARNFDNGMGIVDFVFQ